MLSIQSYVRMKKKKKTHAVSSRLLPQCAGRDRNSLKSRRCGEANKRHSNLHDRALSNPSESSPRQQKQPRRYRATLKINLIKHILENSVMFKMREKKNLTVFVFVFSASGFAHDGARYCWKPATVCPSRGNFALPAPLTSSLIIALMAVPSLLQKQIRNK